MAKTVKVAVSLPRDVFAKLERVRRKERRSRSELASEAIRCWLAGVEEQGKDRAYREAYRRLPEDEGELQVGELGLDLLAREPWK